MHWSTNQPARTRASHPSTNKLFALLYSVNCSCELNGLLSNWSPRLLVANAYGDQSRVRGPGGDNQYSQGGSLFILVLFAKVV